MKARTFKAIWAIVQITLLVVPIVACLWYVPYSISHDQHMVDTVNERAWEYDGNGTLTDFTEAEIMSNDAQLDYEERVWKLDHQELYYIRAIMIGIAFSLLFQMWNVVWYLIYDGGDPFD